VRILLVSAYALPHIGGVEVIADQLARQLVGRGHDITHITSSAGADEGGADPPYRVLRIAATNRLEPSLGVPYPIFAPRLLPVLRREVARTDLVHAHGYVYASTIAAFELARHAVPPPPLVLTEHVGHVPYRSPLLDKIEAAAVRLLGRRSLRRADAVVTYNDRVAEQLRALCPSIAPLTILNGVDPQLFRPAEEDERKRLRAELGWDERPRVLFVGRPVAKKGFPLAVAAVRAAAADATLAVAGAERLPAGTPPGVEALGRLPHQRLAEVYRASDVLLVPSWGEGFPLIAQEGLASGLPLVLAADPGYAPNLNGAGAAVREIERPDGFARTLAELLADPAALAEASRAARAHAISAFSWPRAATEHERLYRRLSGQE
jgi:glycosyltransferase involved in cell wall biosynthesis